MKFDKRCFYKYIKMNKYKHFVLKQLHLQMFLIYFIYIKTNLFI